MLKLGVIVAFVVIGLSMGQIEPQCQECQANKVSCETETKYFICMGKKLRPTLKDFYLGRNFM